MDRTPRRGSQGAARREFVTALRETVPNAYLITLDNGQVWRQNRAQEYPLQPGQRVTLHATRWGHSYRLSVASLNGFIQVERVR